MPQKTIYIDDIGEVTLVKRRGSRNLRLSFTRNGDIRVSLPYWVPYQAGSEFARSKRDWIAKHRPETGAHLQDGDRIGKAHRLRFVASTTAKQASVRVASGQITVSCPVSSPSTSISVQKAAERGALKALKTEADRLLPQRLRELANKHGFIYKSVATKRLSSRWGSCSQNKEITLNTYLMQLPWELIDYVIVHELVHTEHLNHSDQFWYRFSQVMPDARARRKMLKTHKTAISPA